MSIERIQLLRNVGQFDSVAMGAGDAPFKKLTLLYAENGRGKTTLAAVFRSARSGKSQPILERHRLGATHPPHVVLAEAGGKSVIFQNGGWDRPLKQIAVFDDVFVAQNVCSGMEIETGHRQNLHELILGSQGVRLSSLHLMHVARIEEHNRELRLRGDAVPSAQRGALSPDAFCALLPNPSVDADIMEAERRLAAARASEPIRQQQAFRPLLLPSFDADGISSILALALPDLQTDAADAVQAHLAHLGTGAEGWIGDGMRRVPGASTGADHAVCPFCAQNLAGSTLITHYQGYFSAAYVSLKQAVAQSIEKIVASHDGDAAAAFERNVRLAVENRTFWQAFIKVPAIDLDTAAVVISWREARDAVVSALRQKQAAPLEQSCLSDEAYAAINRYHETSKAIEALSDSLVACNAQIALVKEQSAAANVSALEADLIRLNAVRARFGEATVALCQRYLEEKAAKVATEKLRDDARDDLDKYRKTIFVQYEAAINLYLARFNAGFRLGSVASVNNRGGSACTYSVLINTHAVALSAEAGPSFRNTLSAGDRNTLALAFFFASLEQDPSLATKIVVIDDPMTSLDEHRSLTTVQEMRRLLAKVSQMIVLSHSKSFLCALWEGTDTKERAAALIARAASGSTIAPWDVRQDCITEHDRRHELVSSYLKAATSTTEREVAAALRPILEVFVRVAYPAFFPPGSLLGPFIGACEQGLKSGKPILTSPDIVELRDLVDYANRFHHDSNSAYATATVNDHELTYFAQRTLAFSSRP